MSREQRHEHDEPLEPDWFKVLDVVVWVSVAVIVTLAAEWILGLITRERISRAAAKITADAAAKRGTPAP